VERVCVWGWVWCVGVVCVCAVSGRANARKSVWCAVGEEVESPMQQTCFKVSSGRTGGHRPRVVPCGGQPKGTPMVHGVGAHVRVGVASRLKAELLAGV